jgi:HD-GYP domain-containing protein (c-di-GMP phosphodiesterase class II)
MKLIPLTEVRTQIRSGVPLPWGVRDAEGKLLLGKGHVLASDAMVAALMARGMFVDADEAKASRGDVIEKQAVTFAMRWNALHNRLATVLRAPGDPQFAQRIGECVTVTSQFGERDTDQLIFTILRQDADKPEFERYTGYGLSHALHVAALVSLLARRAQWSPAQTASGIAAGLTMNLSIVELQGQLAIRGGRLNRVQTDLIRAHPAASADLLRRAGVADPVWLEAVEQHHEEVGGGGYPKGVAEPSEVAQMLRYVDIFLAKHAGRTDREPVPAQQAARDLFVASKGHSVAAMLIKEFGIYPPGCFVRLASGETAIVVRRGASANTPLAAALANRNGDPISGYPKRDTSLAQFAVQGTLTDKSVRVRVPADKLFQ